MVVYDCDSNSILAEPMKSRSGTEMRRAHQTIFECLSKRGFRPKLQRLDDEVSRELKEFMEEKDVDFQLTPTHSHRRNAAERAIRTFKNHFIAILCGTDPDFPLILWDNGHETLLGPRSHRATTIPGALEERSAKFGRLFYKAPSRPLPCRHATSLLTCGMWIPIRTLHVDSMALVIDLRGCVDAVGYVRTYTYVRYVR